MNEISEWGFYLGLSMLMWAVVPTILGYVVLGALGLFVGLFGLIVAFSAWQKYVSGGSGFSVVRTVFWASFFCGVILGVCKFFS